MWPSAYTSRAVTTIMFVQCIGPELPTELNYGTCSKSYRVIEIEKHDLGCIAQLRTFGRSGGAWRRFDKLTGQLEVEA